MPSDVLMLAHHCPNQIPGHRRKQRSDLAVLDIDISKCSGGDGVRLLGRVGKGGIIAVDGQGLSDRHRAERGKVNRCVQSPVRISVDEKHVQPALGAAKESPFCATRSAVPRPCCDVSAKGW